MKSTAAAITPVANKTHKERSGILDSDSLEALTSFDSETLLSQLLSDERSKQERENSEKKKKSLNVDKSSLSYRRKSFSEDLNSRVLFESWTSGEHYSSLRTVSTAAESFPQLFRKSFIFCQHYVDINSIIRFRGEPLRGVPSALQQCSLKSTGEARTCRIISKSSLNKLGDVEDLQKDIRILKMLQPNETILQLSAVYEDSMCVYLLSKDCSGETLGSRMRDKRTFSEKEAAMITSQLASALDFSHRMGIMHRDLKPMKILMASSKSDTDIRLADFGSAACFQPGQRLKQLIGSPLFIAPSVLQQNYGTEADLWSLGVIVHMLLAGVPPFTGRNNAELFRNIQHGQLNLNIKQLASVSEEGKNLLSLLLCRKTTEAISAAAVLEHPWIAKHCPQIPPVEKSPPKTERLSDLLETAKPAKVYSLSFEAPEKRQQRRHSIGSVFSGELKTSVGLQAFSHRMSFSGSKRSGELGSKLDDDTVCEAVRSASKGELSGNKILLICAQ